MSRNTRRPRRGGQQIHGTPVANRWIKTWTAFRRFLAVRGGVIFLEYAILIALTVIGLRYAVSAIAGG